MQMCGWLADRAGLPAGCESRAPGVPADQPAAAAAAAAGPAGSCHCRVRARGLYVVRTLARCVGVFRTGVDAPTTLKEHSRVRAGLRDPK
jgi:hypothetical protein